jgi:predicted RNA-binding Zn-ribbon protein involved in translation (DUF1610 family)
MISISKFKIKRNNQSEICSVFFIESEGEFALCPNCGDSLIYHSWVSRPLKDLTGAISIYIIRVLKCTNTACPKTYHRELPDIITPYKRYSTESIEEVLDLDDSRITIAVDQLTIYRWRKWFALHAEYIMMALLSVSATIENNTETSSLVIQEHNSNKPREKIKEIVSRKVKWLNETVRILVNSSKWSFNRSAFFAS